VADPDRVTEWQLLLRADDQRDQRLQQLSHAELIALPRPLDFYRCYRAYVRGKVARLRLAEPGLSPEQAAEVASEARTYFDLAWAYAGGRAQLTLGRKTNDQVKEV